MSNRLFITILVVSVLLLVGGAKLLFHIQNNTQAAAACRASGFVWLGDKQLCVMAVKP